MLFTHETFGEDADGNRGVRVWCHEFENTAEECEEIASLLYEGFVEGETEGNVVVSFNNPNTDEDVEIEVEIEDYVDLLISKVKKEIELQREIVEDAYCGDFPINSNIESKEDLCKLVDDCYEEIEILKGCLNDLK